MTELQVRHRYWANNAPIFLIAALAIGLRLTIGSWPVDDAYITFRYSRNLLEGYGLVYNPGQSVLGTTTPLYAIALSLFASLTRLDIPTVSLLINAACDAVVILSLYWIIRRQRGPRYLALAGGLCWTFYPIGLRYSVGGMEVSLVTALVAVSLVCFLSRRDVWAMVFAAFSVLARPDAIALSLIMVAYLTFERRRMPVRPVLAWASVLLPPIALLTIVYGSPLPQSLQAKSHAIYWVMPWENFHQILFQIGGVLLGGPLGLSARGFGVTPSLMIAALLILAAVILIAISVVGAIRLLRLDRRQAVIPAYAMIVCVVYSGLGLRGNLIAEWYVVPIVANILVCLFVGTAVLASWAKSQTAVTALALVLMSVQIAGLNWGRIPDRGYLAPLAIWDERERLYQQVAGFLHDRLQTGDMVAASEIGALGYFCGCQILDTVGLVSPESIKYYPLPNYMYAINYAIPPDLIRSMAPEYVVSLDIFTRRSLITADWFANAYQEIWSMPTDVFFSQKLQVFERRSSAH